VDLEAYTPGASADRASTRAALGLDPDAFVVLFAGRIEQEKGVDVLIGALRLLVEVAPRCHLVIVGSPSPGTDPALAHRYVERLHGLAEGLPVTWLPRRSDVVPLLQAADAAVVPSVWAEPLSRSILEAIACGVPVVATRVGGSPEILTGWLAEYLVEPGDPGALAEPLAGLCEWRTRDVTLGDRCRRFAESRLSPDGELDLIEAAMLGTERQR